MGSFKSLTWMGAAARHGGCCPYTLGADPRFPRSVHDLFLSGDSSFAFCDSPFAVAAFIVFLDFWAFIIVFMAFDAIVAPRTLGYDFDGFLGGIVMTS